MATMLANIQTVCQELGLNSPSSVAGSTDKQIIQLLALMNRVGDDLLHEFEWNKLSVPYRFYTQASTLTGTLTDGSAVVTGISSTAGLGTTYNVQGTGIQTDTNILSVDSATQVTLDLEATETGAQSLTFSKISYPFPGDYDRLISRTDWNKTNFWELIGPETAQQWEWLKSGLIASGPRTRFRILGGLFEIWPPPTADIIMGFEYVSSYWALSTLGVAKAALTVDTDTSVFRDNLLVLGTKLKFYEIKGFDTTTLATNYNRQLQLAKEQDKDGPTLSMAPRLSTVLIGYDNIPDSNYGS
jgi:hypothetical protein